SPCEITASATIMNGCYSSIIILDPCAVCCCDHSVFPEHVLDHFIQHFRLHGFLHEMPCPALQRRHDVLLITDRRHHDDTCVRILLHDLFGSFNAFHLRHGNVHERNVGLTAFVFSDGRHSVTGLTSDLAPK